MKTFSRTFVVLCLALLCIVSAFAQVPGYQLPSTLVAQKWYGSGAPTAALNIQSQPGDMYYDTTNKVAYWCCSPGHVDHSIAGWIAGVHHGDERRLDAVILTGVQ